MHDNVVVNPCAARGVDAVTARQMLFEAQHGIVSVYEELFSAIAPIKRNGNGDIMNGLSGAQAAGSDGSSSGSSSSSSSSNSLGMAISSRSSRSKVHALRSDQFTSAQLQKFTHMAGYITNQLTASELLLRHYARNDANDGNAFSLENELKRMQEVLLERKRNEEKNMKKISALQQYLAIELQRSDEAKRDVEDKENEKELLIVERNELLKLVGPILTEKSGKLNRTLIPIPIPIPIPTLGII